MFLFEDYVPSKYDIYSYLKASTGFSLDPLYAGTTPETTPMITATESAITTGSILTTATDHPFSLGKKHKKGKKILPMRAVYLLISIFWLINLFVLGPRRFLPFELKLALQIISVIVFFIIYYKVAKWVK